MSTAKHIQMWTGTASNVAQVLALIIVGLWTKATFSVAEKPSLEPHLTTEVDVNWQPVMDHKDFCQAVVNIKVANNSKNSVDITKMTVTGWMANLNVTHKTDVQFIDDEKLKEQTKFFEQSYTSGYLTGHFPPNTVSEDSLSWFFKRQKNKYVIWSVDFEFDGKLKYPAKAYVDDFLCDEDSND